MEMLLLEVLHAFPPENRQAAPTNKLQKGACKLDGAASGNTCVPSVQLGSSKGLKVGQSVFAIGNPRGLSRTMTAGVVSGLNRAIPSPVNTLTYGAIQVGPIPLSALRRA